MAAAVVLHVPTLRAEINIGGKVPWVGWCGDDMTCTWIWFSPARDSRLRIKMMDQPGI